jgi:hypothetical protein
MFWRRPKTKDDRMEEEKLRKSGSFTIGQRFDIGETAWDIVSRGVAGSPFNLVTLGIAGTDISISSGTARRGNTAGAGASAVAAQVTGLGGFMAGRVIGGAIGTFIAGLFGTSAGAIIGGGAGSMIGDKIARTGMQRTYNLAIASRPRVRFGGNFKDSQPAYNMRQKSEQELSSSLLSARRYLGREAQLMHQ